MTKSCQFERLFRHNLSKVEMNKGRDEGESKRNCGVVDHMGSCSQIALTDNHVALSDKLNNHYFRL